MANYERVFDLVGLRKDGGLDVGISCRKPFDGTSPLDESLRRKIESYLTAIGVDGGLAIRSRFGCAPDAPIRIVVIHSGQICDGVSLLLLELQRTASEHGVSIVTERREVLH